MVDRSRIPTPVWMAASTPMGTLEACAAVARSRTPAEAGLAAGSVSSRWRNSDRTGGGTLDAMNGVTAWRWTVSACGRIVAGSTRYDLKP